MRLIPRLKRGIAHVRCQDPKSEMASPSESKMSSQSRRVMYILHHRLNQTLSSCGRVAAATIGVALHGSLYDHHGATNHECGCSDSTHCDGCSSHGVLLDEFLSGLSALLALCTLDGCVLSSQIIVRQPNDELLLVMVQLSVVVEHGCHCVHIVSVSHGVPFPCFQSFDCGNRCRVPFDFQGDSG